MFRKNRRRRWYETISSSLLHLMYHARISLKAPTNSDLLEPHIRLREHRRVKSRHKRRPRGHARCIHGPLLSARGVQETIRERPLHLRRQAHALRLRHVAGPVALGPEQLARQRRDRRHGGRQPGH